MPPAKNPYDVVHIFRMPSTMTRATADSYCKSLGGALPLPKSKEENDWLAQFGDTHLGFTVGDGQSLTYTNWRPGEPSGDASEVQLIAGYR